MKIHNNLNVLDSLVGQAKLLYASNSLAPGQAVDLPEHDLLTAAKGDLTGIDWMFPAHEEDVVAFIARVETNWSILIYRNHIDKTFTIEKKRK